MSDITRLGRLVGAKFRGVDISNNTLVTSSVKVGGPSVNTELTKTILDNLVNLQNGSDAASLHNHNAAYHTKSDLASTTNAKGASLIGIEDSANQYTSTNVEGALTEALDAAQAAQATANAAIPATEKGAASGVATLDGTGKVPAAQLPSYVDDVLEYANLAAFPGTGVTSIIYIALDTNKSYRWSGSIYVEVSPSDVNSVNGQTGIVVLTTDNVNEGSTNLYHTTARARTAAVVNSTAGSQTDQAPSVSSIKSYVTAAIAAISSEALVRTGIAGESLSSGVIYALRWGKVALSESAGRLYKADYDTTTNDNFRVVGLFKPSSAIVAGDPITFTKLGLFTATSHGFTIGEPVYLTASGALSSTAPSTALQAVVEVGSAENANVIDVQINAVGVN